MRDISEYYRRRNLDSELPEALGLLEWLEGRHGQLDEVDCNKIDRMMADLVNHEKNTVKNIVYLMRYYLMAKRNDIYIHLTRYTGFLDVIENILLRLKERVPLKTYEQITEGFVLPVLGTAPKALPEYIVQLMNRFQRHLNENLIAEVLAGNNHGIPERAFASEKAAYEAAPDLETYLKDLHACKVAELEDYMRQGKVWFEQAITQEVVDFVKGNQEVLSARLVGDKLYLTKIPYDTKAYLEAKTLDEKKYYGCHCPFAREAIGKVPALFCHCSGGFTKYPFDVIFSQDLPVKCLETILGGSDICRFEIDLSAVDYKGKKNQKHSSRKD
ncbi:MAG: hypothetical protein WC399_03500 [Bacilli bacterium]|jgi:hypothetical protein